MNKKSWTVCVNLKRMLCMYCVYNKDILLLLHLGPECMPQMHRSHIGLLCYRFTIQVF